VSAGRTFCRVRIGTSRRVAKGRPFFASKKLYLLSERKENLDLTWISGLRHSGMIGHFAGGTTELREASEGSILGDKWILKTQTRSKQ